MPDLGRLAFVRDELVLTELHRVALQDHVEHDLARTRVTHQKDAERQNNRCGQPQVAPSRRQPDLPTAEPLPAARLAVAAKQYRTRIRRRWLWRFRTKPIPTFPRAGWFSATVPRPRPVVPGSRLAVRARHEPSTRRSACPSFRPPVCLMVRLSDRRGPVGHDSTTSAGRQSRANAAAPVNAACGLLSWTHARAPKGRLPRPCCLPGRQSSLPSRHENRGFGFEVNADLRRFSHPREQPTVSLEQ